MWALWQATLFFLDGLVSSLPDDGEFSTLRLRALAALLILDNPPYGCFLDEAFSAGLSSSLWQRSTISSVPDLLAESLLRPLGRSLAIINDQKNSTDYRKYI